jgi:tRNA(Ile)-lysidine synthase
MDIPSFEKHVIDYSISDGLFDRTDRVLLAISGGADSTALLHVFHRCLQHGHLQQVPICIHFDHQLRQSESPVDSDFVQACVGSVEMEFQCEKINVREYAKQHQVSVELAGRELRQDRLVCLARANNCTVIATGHHQDDNAETVLQRLTRGTGLRGLAGIWPKRIIEDRQFVSPLLCVGRAEIHAYLKARQLPWRDDKTNSDCSFRRNFIRHQLMPALQETSMEPLTVLLNTLSTQARKLHEQVSTHSKGILPQLTARAANRTTLLKTGFLSVPDIMQAELIRGILVDLGCGERNLSTKHYQRVIQLARSTVSGKCIQLPQGFVVYNQYEHLIFSRQAKESNAAPRLMNAKELSVPGLTEFGPYTIKTSISEATAAMHSVFLRTSPNLTEHLDWDGLNLPLSVRFRRAGDRFCPLGRRTPQKLSKFLIKAKIPAGKRDRLLVLTDTCKVIWVCPTRISDAVKITARTRRVIKIEVQSNLLT